MLRKRGVPEDTLLPESSFGVESSGEDPSDVTFRLSVHSQGSSGRIKIYEDGSFSFKQTEEQSLGQSLCSQCWCNSCTGDLEVPGADVIGATLEGETGLRIWYCSLPAKRQEKPVRSLHSSQLFLTDSLEEAQRCQQCLQQICCWVGHSQPRKLLVLINPKSGQGRSKQIFYSKDVQSVLQAAGLEVAVRETQHRGHATEIVRQLPIGSCDALVTVGGDGTVFEALQGLLTRPDWQQACQLPFAMLPTGSGNALSANTGMWDVVTAAHAICKGRTHPIDIVSMLQPPSRRYFSFLSLSFGLVSNLDIGTEHLRWMGGIRFTVGALQQIVLSKTHQAHIAILPQDQAEPLLQDLSVENGSAGNDTQASAEDGLGPATPLLDAFCAHFPSQASWPQQLPEGWEDVSSSELQICAACNLPWLDTTFKLAPQAHLSSGCLDFIYTTKASRLQGLEMMTKVDTGKHLGMPMVQCRKVCAMVLEPVSQGSWLTLDGEAIAYERIYAEVHRGLCRVIVA